MRPDAAMTTSPELVKEVVLMCKEAGAKRVTVTDHTIRVARTCLERTGMKAALDGIDGVKLSVPSKKSGFKSTGIERGKSLKTTEIAKDYLDATRCLTTNGPSGPGEVVNLGKVMCSTDTVGLDAYATTLLDWGGKALKPEDIGHIKFAAEHGLGEMDLAKVEIVEAIPVKTG